MAALGDLAGRVALITGAGSGIGRAICQVFAREGAIIAAVDINKDTALQTVNSLPPPSIDSHHAFHADVSDSESVKEMMKNVQASFSSLPTVAVNCAGIMGNSSLLDMTIEKFNEVLDVNLKGTFLVTQAFSKAVISSGIKPAAIVNISSIVGKCGYIYCANYAASKGGIIAFTKSAALEFAKNGIRVNAVLPGITDTPMTAHVTGEVKRQTESLIPLGRFARPEEIAEACLFLASEKSSYVTATTLEVTGGHMA